MMVYHSLFFSVLLCYLFITYTFNFSANKNTYESRILAEPALGHLRYSLSDVPPQPNSPPDTIIRAAHSTHEYEG